MAIQIKALRALKDNYIWLLSTLDSSEAWVVDPGEARPVLQALKGDDLQLQGILITHHHWDHSAGVDELLAHHPEAVVAGSIHSPLSCLNLRLSEGEELKLLGETLGVLEIPGHTLDHLAYFNERLLFSGDTLFSAGCGRVFEGTAAMIYASLGKLRVLGDETRVYCGHEYTVKNLRFAREVEPGNEEVLKALEALRGVECTLPSRLGWEKEVNPFLRCGLPGVREMAEKVAGKRLGGEEEVFAVLREWKDGF